MSETIGPRDINRLGEQYQLIKEKIGIDLLPPSQLNELSGRDFLEVLQEKYPRRYDLVRDLCDELLSGAETPEIDEEEIANIKKMLQAFNSLDTYISSHRAANEQDRTLRPRQFNVFEDLRDFLEEGLTKGYVKLPTGVGKTVIFIELIKSFKLKSLVVVPSNVLITQTQERIGQFAGDLDVGQINQDVKRVGGDITVITYDSLITGVRNGTLDPTIFDCVVLDEAHEALGPKTREALQHPGFEKAIQIGFTATPKYSETKQVANILPHEIHAMGIQEAVEEGSLAGFRVIIAKTNISLKDVKISASGAYNEKQVDKAINVAKRNQAAVDLYKKMFNGQKVVLYCNSVQHAKDVSALFKKAGIGVEAVWGEQSKTAAGKKQQKETLLMLKDEKIQGVANARMLIVGWDDPTVKVCFNLVPTASLVDAEQRGGRVLRLLADAQATIVDFIDEDDEKRFPITFVEVANASEIPPGKPEAERKGKEEEAAEAQPEIKIEGLTLITKAAEVLRFVKEKTDKKYDLPPTGWESATKVAAVTKRSVSTIIRSIRIVRPILEMSVGEPVMETFRNVETGGFEYHFHPQLTKEVIAYFEQQQKQQEARAPRPAPTDWVAITTLYEKYGQRGVTIALTALKKRWRDIDSHIGFFIDPTGKRARAKFTSPTLDYGLCMELEAQKQKMLISAPVGWVELTTLQLGPHALNEGSGMPFKEIDRGRFPGQFARCNTPDNLELRYFVSPMFAGYLEQMSHEEGDRYKVIKEEGRLLDRETREAVMNLSQQPESSQPEKLDELRSIIAKEFAVEESVVKELFASKKFLEHFGGKYIENWGKTSETTIQITLRAGKTQRTVLIFKEKLKRLNKSAYDAAQVAYGKLTPDEKRTRKPPDLSVFMEEGWTLKSVLKK